MPRKKVVSYPLPFVEPMAPLRVAELPEGVEWSYEVKWDGFRALAFKEGGSARLISRTAKSLTAKFPAIQSAVTKLAAESAIIDGEIVALDSNGRPSFQMLQNNASAAATIALYAFDLLHLDGLDLTQEPLEKRREKLAKLIAGSGLRLSPPLNGTGSEVLAAVAKMGLEGIVAKRRGSTYQPGERNTDWKKLRVGGNEQEFVIGGYRPPGTEPFESILVGVYEGGKLMFAGKIRAGFTPHTRQAVWDLIKDEETTVCPFGNLPTSVKNGRWGEGVTEEEMKALRIRSAVNGRQRAATRSGGSGVSPNHSRAPVSSNRRGIRSWIRAARLLGDVVTIANDRVPSWSTSHSPAIRHQGRSVRL